MFHPQLEGLSTKLLPLIACFIGCGLSKDEARSVIEHAAYSDDPSVYCTWTSFPDVQGSGKDAVYVPGEEHKSCVDALVNAEIVVRAQCMRQKPTEFVECKKNNFTLGPKGSFQKGRVRFACGQKSLREVTSVATEGNEARVKYTRTVTIEKDWLDVTFGASGCTLETPDDGAEELTIILLKDDDGNWSVK